MNKSKLKRVYKYSSLILIVCWFVYTVLNFPDCFELQLKEKSIEYRGIVIDKFIDKENHLYKTIVLSNNNIENKVIIPSRDNSGLFNYLKLGDSVVKNPETLSIKIYRKKILRTLTIDFDCE